MALSTEQAWNALHNPLRLFIRKRVPDDDSAEDLLQDVFLKIHTHIGTLRDEEKLESWVYQIARNLIIDYYRRQTPTTSWEEAEPLLPVEEIPEEDVRAELAPSVVAMARYLPEPYREALLLTDYQGLSQNGTLSTSRSVIFRCEIAGTASTRETQAAFGRLLSF